MIKINWSLQHKHDTAANWTTDNPKLLVGQFGFETDTNKLKCGDGDNFWNDLDYITGSVGATEWGQITGNIEDQSDLAPYVNSLNNYQSVSTGSPGVTLIFGRNRIWNTVASPATGDFALSTPGTPGIINIVIHQQGSTPNFAAGLKKLSGTYSTTAVNVLKFQHFDDSNVFYTIEQLT